MKVQWAMLANAAELRGGLLSMLGGGWDTVRSTLAPGDGAPAAVLRGVLVTRVLLSRSEAGAAHTIQLKVIDADGRVQAETPAISFSAPLNPNLPAGWDQGVILPIDVTGVALSQTGVYEIAIHVDDHYAESVSFQVVRVEAQETPA